MTPEVWVVRLEICLLIFGGCGKQRRNLRGANFCLEVKKEQGRLFNCRILGCLCARNV